MKNIYLLLASFIFISINLNVNASVIAPSIALTGTTLEDTSGAGYGGKLIFPDKTDSNGVKILTSGFNQVTGLGDMQITGNFWLQNLSDIADATSGWVTFDIGSSCLNSVGSAIACPSKVKLTNIGSNKFRFEGYAWSNAAGWIYFGNTGVSGGEVIYDRGTQRVNGCGFSENIGWVCINNFFLDTTPPEVSEVKPFSANHNKSLILTENNFKEIKLTRFDNSAIITSNSLSNLDFRTAKTYYIELYDNEDNFSTGYVNVVAGVPVLTFDSTHPIPGATSASNFLSSLGTDIVGDGVGEHNINFTLKDTYGNIVKTESGIKKVDVEVSLDNTVHKNQVDNSIIDLGYAIRYSGNIPMSFISNSGTYDNNTGFYDLDISSYTPTSQGYAETTAGNDINLRKILVKITPLSGNAGVGETAGIDFTSNIGTQKFKFTPAVKVTTLSNDRMFNLIRDIETYFTGTVVRAGSASPSITGLKVYNLVDILNSGSIANWKMSLQNINSTNGSNLYVGYLKPNFDNTNYTYYSVGDTSLNTFGTGNTSVIVKSYPSITGTISDGFKGTPKIVTSNVGSMGFKYSSIVSYNNGGVSDIKYKSYSLINSSALANKEIKIAGLAQKSNKSSSLIADSSINYIGKLDKSAVYANIKKNVQTYKKSGSVGTVEYYNTGKTISSFPSGIDTIIVDGGDIIISGDIVSSTNVKSIIALKKADGTGGNIWIKSNVKNINAILVAERSLLSGDGTNFANLTGLANNQLFIKGSILSYNTIGGASSNVAKCPFYVTSCNETEAKKYDFNHFRSYINGYGVSAFTTIPTTPGYSDSPMIVEYDSKVQLKTPKIFIINK